MRRTIIRVLLLAVLLPTASARASILYGDAMGATVWFRGIQESSPTGDPLPLYGAPAVNGDQLVFPTTGSFAAESLGGGAPDGTDGKLNIMIEAKPGFSLSSFEIEENGLVALNAPFGGDAFAEVLSFGVVKVLEIAGAPVDLPAISAFLAISPLGGQYQLSLIGGSSFASSWAGSTNVGLPESTTKLTLALDNSLFASTLGSGTRAFLDKKLFVLDVHSVGVPVPEPAASLLGVMVALAVGLVRRDVTRS